MAEQPDPLFLSIPPRNYLIIMDIIDKWFSARGRLN